jgi:hypothetical protein
MPFQLSPPGSPGFAIVPSRHASTPVSASSPTICGPPNFAATPVPVVPTMTLPRATSGPPFNPSRRRKSPTFVSQTTAPVATSSATTRTSDVPRYKRSPCSASPRL